MSQVIVNSNYPDITHIIHYIQRAPHTEEYQLNTTRWNLAKIKYTGNNNFFRWPFSKLSISAIYSPPKFNNKQKYEDYLKAPGSHFLSKTYWGPRLITPKGKRTIQSTKSKQFKIFIYTSAYWSISTHIDLQTKIKYRMSLNFVS